MFPTRNKLSLCLRYVGNDNVHEVFPDVAEVERITGSTLADAILQRLADWGLPVSGLRGQYYDGSSGNRRGCRAIIEKITTKATYVHCVSHQLNLAVVSAYKIRANAESTVGEIAQFFRFSAKRQNLLDKAIDEEGLTPKSSNMPVGHVGFILCGLS